MKVECVHCGASGQMDESRIPPGVTSLKCPRCEKNFPIPTVPGQEATEEAAPEEPFSFAAPPRPVRAEPALFDTPEVTAPCSACGAHIATDEMVRFGDSWVCAACKPGYVQLLAQGKPRPGEMRYAGFGIRFGAKFLDSLILGMVSFLLSLAIGFSLPKGSPQVAVASGVLSFILNITIAAAYSGYFLNKNQATPGKMACGLLVVSPQGGRISVGRGVGRYFGELLSSLTMGIGYLMVLFDSERRSLHDRVCDTRVIYK